MGKNKKLSLLTSKNTLYISMLSVVSMIIFTNIG